MTPDTKIAPIPEMPEFIGRSPAFLQLIESIRQVAPTQITVLITGESGSGKEMVARAIHQLSSRKTASMISVNCGAIPEGILESELFGHEKGAFTGASEARKGYFEMADGGSIFLDEIGEMPLATQVKLLRILELQSFMRVGSSRSIQVDVRVLAATNKNLEDAVERGEFRNDLFYRLNAVHLIVPPLRKRREDIPLFIDLFKQEICRSNQITCPDFSEDALDYLINYHWPGNIRELRNFLERILIFHRGPVLSREVVVQQLSAAGTTEAQLPMVLHRSAEEAERELIYRALLDIRVALEDLRRLIVHYHERRIEGERVWTPPGQIVHEGPKDEALMTIQEIEKQQIEKALLLFGNNRRKAASALGIGERTLYRKLKEYELE
jgi:transcriptional regulator with PAS, ATPase and Fis domain